MICRAVTKIEGHLIVVSLESKKHKIFIIQVYLPCDSKESQKIQEKLEKILTQKMKKNYEIILMRDFNTVSNPHRDRLQKNTESTFSLSNKPEIQLFTFLHNSGLIDIQQTWEGDNITYTWANKQSASRIDYMWTTKKLAIDLQKFQNLSFKDITNSDHSLLCLTLPTDDIIFTTPILSRGKQTKKTIIEIDKTTPKQWDKFEERTTKKILESNLLEEISNTYNINLSEDKTKVTINNLWSRFENIIIASALLCLHCTKKV
jgi:hypothetical protein